MTAGQRDFVGRRRAARLIATAVAAAVPLAACSSTPSTPSGASSGTSSPSVTGSSAVASSPSGTSTGTSISGTGRSTAHTMTDAPITASVTTASATGTTTPTGPITGVTTARTTGTTTPTGPITGVTVAGTIATDLTTPWGLGFLPDGTALVTERDTGKLLAIAPGSGHAVRTVGTVSGVVPGGEGGLLGLAVSPPADRSADSPADHPTVFVYYTADDDNRVAALTLNADATAITAQHAILTGIPKSTIHNGGRIAIDPDGDLYIGTGDATNSDGAQSLDYLGGKILRVTQDGKPAPGNPFANAPLVYSYGHRNVQGLAFDAHGQLWASEFGASAYDELNRIEPGGNYGWPEAEGPSDNPDFVAPYAYWPTSEASPSGLAIAGETAFMAALRGIRLWLIPLTGSAGKVTPVPQLEGKYGRLRTVVVAPDGSLWLTTSNTDGRGDPRPGDDRILRLRVNSG